MAGTVLFVGSAGVAGVPASQEMPQGFTTPIEADTGRGIRTGFAVMNLDAFETTLDISILAEEGGLVLAGQVLALPPLGRLSLFADEIPWSVDVDFTHLRGSLRVRSPGRIAAVAIQSRPAQFATLPVSPLKD